MSTTTTNSIHVVAVNGERPTPSSHRNTDSDQIVSQQQQVDQHHRHHRFVPPCISLQSDAPGYYQNNENGIPSLTLHNKRGNTNDDGPICWKCRGTGQKKQRPTTPSPGPTATATTITPAEMNDDHLIMASFCTVCHGKGRIMIIPRPPPPPHINDDDDDDDLGGVGLITRGRRRRSGAASTVSTFENDVSSMSPFCLDPVGYSVPYFGTLVQRATTQCVDVRIVYQNDHSLLRPPTTIRRIDIGNHRTTDGTIVNTKTTSHDDDDDDIDTTTNHIIHATILKQEQVPNNVMEAYPIWLPIHQPREQLCNFVGHWRILQRYKSHRYTTDDVVTAMVACRECFPVMDRRYRTSSSIDPIPISYCDLGTGNGSVLQMVLWKVLESSAAPHDNHHPLQCVYGFEARQEAVELLLRSLAFNIGTDTPLRNKVTIVRADFRSYCHDPSRAPLLHHQFDVVTGTPPYFQVDFHIPVSSTSSSTSPPISNDNNNTDSNQDTQLPHPDAGTTNITATIRQGGMPLSIQSAPARCEFRGGIEAYCCTASYLLKPGSGQLCICENYCNHQRALQSFDAHRLILTKYYIIEGKVGRGPLFCVYVARKKANREGDEINNETTLSPDIIQLAVRDENGEWTDDYKRLVLDYLSIIY